MFFQKRLSLYLTFVFAVLVASLFVGVNSAYADVSGAFVGQTRTSMGRIEVDFQVANPQPAAPLSGITVVVFGDAIYCTHSFNADINNSYGKTFTAVCDMGGTNAGTYDINLINDSGGASNRILDTISVPYNEGTPSVGTGKFLGHPIPSAGKVYTFNIELGRAGINTYANIAISHPNLPAPWQDGHQYDCAPEDLGFNWFHPITVTITCNMSNLPDGSYTMTLYDSRNTSTGHDLDTVDFDISTIDLRPPVQVGTAEFPNRFNLSVDRLTDAAPKTFYFKILNSDGTINNSFSQLGTSDAPGVATFPNVNLNVISPGTYDLGLVGENGEIYDRETITIIETALTNTCSCKITNAATSCNPAPLMSINSNSCLAGTTPQFRCSQSSTGASCSCTCGGTPTTNGGGGVIEDAFNIDDLSGFFKLLQNAIIAIAVLAGVFIVPYAFVLMASGNPEKIKQGSDWLKSIFWGYLIIFLAGVLIRIVGGEILSFGFGT